MTTKKESNALISWIFIRGIGFIYLIAFISFYTQCKGLIGEEGILPFASYLDRAHSSLGNISYLLIPTINWINTADEFMQWQLILSTVISVLLIAGIFPIIGSILLWLSYLSLVNAGQIFMSFQWDALLLEAGFLTIFISSFRFLSRPNNAEAPSQIIIFLFKILLFKLMFSSGIGKLLSGDETWRNLSALNYHYFTQPIPNPLAWYIHQLPEWFHKLSVIITLIIEIIVPFFFFGPKKPKYIAGLITILFQLTIMATGNYAYFNLLTIFLCIFIYEDSKLPLFIARDKIQSTDQYQSIVSNSKSFNARQSLLLIFAIIILSLNIFQFSRRYLGLVNIARPLVLATKYISGFHIVNNYGLFTVMTTQRPEIIIEGSNDGRKWLAYEFKYKPGDPKKSLPLVAPHQPRLDWQMWFAALGDYRSNPWLLNLLYGIRNNSKDLTQLLKTNAFDQQPPVYLRAMLYEYTFTDRSERRENGSIWNRTYIGFYLPVIIK